jgi:hypothetical protein
VPGVRPRVSFLRRGPAAGGRCEDVIRRKLVEGILNVNFWWHSRQMLLVDSPATEMMPGKG